MINPSTRVIFGFGFISGTLLSCLMVYDNNETIDVHEENTKTNMLLYENCIKNNVCSRKNIPFDSLRYDYNKYLLESKILFESVSILCLILITKDSNFEAIKNTWGQNCNSISSLNLIKRKKNIFPLKQNQTNYSWIKLCEYIKNVPDIHKWVLIVTDDTFVIMENLRYFVSSKNSSDYYYLGYPVKFWNVIYNAGKAGYLLSNGIVKLMKKSVCDINVPYRNKEDFMLGYHLYTFNISARDIEDNGYSVFHPYSLNRLLYPHNEKHSFEPVYSRKCCSKHTVSFNAIEGDKMYTYYYLLYVLQLFHYGNLGNRPPKKISDVEVWQTFLKEQNLPMNITSDKYYLAWEKLIDSPHSFGRNMKREEYIDE